LECGRSTTFTVSVEGITETEAAGIHKLCTTIAIAHARQAKRLYCTSAMNYPLKNHDPPCLCPTCRRFCESAMANKITRNDRHPLDLASRRLSLKDITETQAIALRVCHEQSETLQKFAPKSKDLQKPVATWRSPCDSVTADKVMRNDNGREYLAPEATREVVAAYPASIRNWISRHGGPRQRPILLRGRELMALYPLCR
jgi:hypothetical protein